MPLYGAVDKKLYCFVLHLAAHAWLVHGLKMRSKKSPALRELCACAGNIVRTAFNSNTAGGQGGAVFGTSSSGNILNSTFTTNKANQARALWKQAPSLALTRVSGTLSVSMTDGPCVVFIAPEVTLQDW